MKCGFRGGIVYIPDLPQYCIGNPRNASAMDHVYVMVNMSCEPIQYLIHFGAPEDMQIQTETGVEQLYWPDGKFDTIYMYHLDYGKHPAGIVVKRRMWDRSRFALLRLFHFVTGVG